MLTCNTKLLGRGEKYGAFSQTIQFTLLENKPNVSFFDVFVFCNNRSATQLKLNFFSEIKHYCFERSEMLR